VIHVDTHVVAWLAFNQDQISRDARMAIDEWRPNRGGLAISDITLVEMATLRSKRRSQLNISLERYLREVKTTAFTMLGQLSRTPARNLVILSACE
jgi:PIN domain nuclease of toxin-antitoxin system